MGVVGYEILEVLFGYNCCGFVTRRCRIDIKLLQVSSSFVTDDTIDSGFSKGQPTSNPTLTAFLNKYGITPAQWLVQNKGMSFDDVLYTTPD